MSYLPCCGADRLCPFSRLGPVGLRILTTLSSKGGCSCPRQRGNGPWPSRRGPWHMACRRIRLGPTTAMGGPTAHGRTCRGRIRPATAGRATASRGITNRVDRTPAIGAATADEASASRSATTATGRVGVGSATTITGRVSAGSLDRIAASAGDRVDSSVATRIERSLMCASPDRAEAAMAQN